jgi:hypothetical protein
MTRRSKRELERALDDLEPGSTTTLQLDPLTDEEREMAEEVYLDAYDECTDEEAEQVDAWLETIAEEDPGSEAWEKAWRRIHETLFKV